MKKYKHLLLLAIAAMLTGCAAQSSIGLVDVQRIVSNWPEYQGYQNQLLSEEKTISSRRESNARKTLDATALQQKYSKVTDKLSQQIRDAAGKIAQAAESEARFDARRHRLRRRRHHRRRREGAQHHGEGDAYARHLAGTTLRLCSVRCKSWPNGLADGSSATAAFGSSASPRSKTRAATR